MYSPAFASFASASSPAFSSACDVSSNTTGPSSIFSVACATRLAVSVRSSLSSNTPPVTASSGNCNHEQSVLPKTSNASQATAELLLLVV